MTKPDIVRQRLAQQRLIGEPLQSPAEVVAWLGAVQSQDYPGAKWSLGLRMQDRRDEAVEQAFNAGQILRTHVMRPTWHFVAPADIRWLLDLTGGRVQAGLGSRYRQLELDADQFARSRAVIARSLAGGQALTRLELGAALESAGISTEGQRLPHILTHAELEGLIVSGPRQGKQHTYALLDERVPPGPRLGREEALAELVRRYFTGHGPATMRDFTWWSGLTVADAKAGLAAAGGGLAQTEIDGETYIYAAAMLPETDLAIEESAFFLPTFDEFLVGYSGFEKSRWAGRAANRQAHFDARILLAGRVAGSWRRTIKKNAVTIEAVPFTPLPADEEEALLDAAERYAAFVGQPAQIEIRQPAAAG